MSRKKTVLIIILAILLVIGFNFLNAMIINPSNYQVKYINIKDEDVPESFQDFSIMFISDVEFGTYFKNDRLTKLTNMINATQADIVIFGGDLFDKAYSPLTQDATALTDALKSISAPYGKFAILGDFDKVSEQRLALVKKILSDADFELLQDNPLTIHRGSSEHINLIGFDFNIDDIDPSDSFANISASDFTVSVIHGARYAASMPLQLSDITVSGHAHHMQVNFPFFIDYLAYPFTGKYGTGKYSLTNTDLYISNGVGTTARDYRLFCDPQVLFFRLSNK